MRYERRNNAVIYLMVATILTLVLLMVLVSGCELFGTPEQAAQTVATVARNAAPVVRDVATGNWFGVAEGVLSGVAALGALWGGNTIRRKRKTFNDSLKKLVENGGNG